ncbi:uncharacterized protein LOC100113667 [Nasonia vitripennis]|uniref:Uncharacterized protein n=1 Tax=Nasonia vitripennis TaxID=7425 RepID=A0A7M7J2G7_NASVI|nr:uncharacterized protein LOC100113667 [Nasonia vitripennis]
MVACSLSFVALFAVCLVAAAVAEEEETYTDKYDHLDVDAVLANDRLRNQYYKCILDTGPCVTPDAIFFKDKIPEVIVTKCRKCTARQKEAFAKVVEWFASNDPPAWDAVIRKAVNEFQMKGAIRRQQTTPRAETRTMSKSLAIVLALCAFAACATAEEVYSDKYDYVDVVSILANDRIRTQYYDCFMDFAPCFTPDAKFFKEKFPEAIVTKCRKCTQKQKDSFEKIVLYYTEKQPEQWKMLLAKAIANSQKKKN